MEVMNMKYTRVLQLQDWINISVVTVHKQFTEEADSESYKSLFTNIYVCENKEPRAEHLLITTGSNLHDVIFTVVEFILKKHGTEKNILTSGFRLLSENSSAQQCSASVECLNFNSCVKRLFHDAWHIFLSRFGDTVFMYLIRRTSLFIKISDSCFVQLTGESICSIPETRPTSSGSKMTRNPSMACHFQPSICRTKKKSLICSSGVIKPHGTKRLKKYEHIQENTYQQLKRASYLFANGKCDDVENDDVIDDIIEQKCRKRSRDQDVNVDDNGSLSEPPAKRQKANDSEQTTNKLNLKSEQTTNKQNLKSEQTTNKLNLNSEQTTNKLNLKSELTTNKLNLKSEQTTNKLNLKSEQTTNKLNLKSEQTTNKLNLKSEQTTNKLNLKSEQTTNKLNLTSKVSMKECSFSYHLALPRNNILFIRNPREKFYRNAVLSTFESTSKSLHTMYINIFCKSPVFEDKESTETNVPVVQDIDRFINNNLSESELNHLQNEEFMFVQILPLLKELVDNHRRCPYKRFLTIHCSVPRNYTCYNNSKKRIGFVHRAVPPTTSRLLANHIHNRKIYLFLRLCMQYVLPNGLFGGRHNFNTILKNVSRVVSLGRREKITIGQIMNGMRTKDVIWLASIKFNNVRLSYLASLLYWLFTEYIFMILRTYFYITDTSFLRYKLVYYRQTTWNLLQNLGIKGLLKQGIITEISEKCCREMVRTKKCLGVSSLRFLPKPKSLRPIINMGRLIQVVPSRTMSVNKQLSSAHSILTYLKNKTPTIVGHGAFGLDDVYTTLKKYIDKWKCEGKPKLFFVKTDISNCYDSMDQTKLLNILKIILSKEMTDEEYVIRKYFSIFPKSGGTKKQFHQVVTPMSEFNVDFISYCQDIVKKGGLHNAVFVDSVIYPRETMVSLLSILEALLSKTIIKIGGHFYRRLSGISQGSVLSTILCYIYYTCMEDEFFNIDEDELLMRIVDDYLFVTPHREHAVKLLDTMISGIDEYNCVTNKEKVLLNFDHTIDNEPLPVVSEEWFPWCGVQINMNTLEVALDCSRYAGTSIKDTLTIELSKNPGQSLKEKMKMSVSRKFHPIYVDRKINTEIQMLTNIYQIFLMSALKLHSGIHQLPYKERADKNPQYFYGIVQDMAHTMTRLIDKLNQDSISDSNLKLMETISWICQHACYVVFKRHHSQYGLILKKLKYEMNQLERRWSVNDKEKLTLLVTNGYSSELMSCLP